MQSSSYSDLVGQPNLTERKFAPKCLWYAGDQSILRSGGRVSIVGSRKASDTGQLRARRLAEAVLESGHVVVSGLAEGIDSVAHHTAIRAGGRTIGVIGTGLDICYPAKNTALQQQMMEEQLVVTQFAPGTPPVPRNFPARNRTMAMISDATVVIEATEQSGTRHQGWEALRLGRTLFIAENVVTSGVTWADEMISHGAEVLTKDTLDSLIDLLPCRTPDWFVDADADADAAIF